MILSRIWYLLLGIAVAVALYVLYVAAGQFDREATRALKEGLASDSQTVEWALKIDSRRRLDALLAGSVDGVLQQALVAADAARDKLPEKARADAKKALGAIREAVPADWRGDALFAVDRDGRVVAETGYDLVATNDDFEMGGYPAVNDALHGWLRDDLWLLGSKMYVVSARPVEYDVTQRPAGAIVALKEVNAKFAQDLANRTRATVVFFADGKSVAAGAAEGFPSGRVDAVASDLKSLDAKAYHDGRTEARLLGADLGVMYARLPGEVWSLGGGFAVARAKTPLGGPSAFLSNADDKDKENVPWLLLVAVALAAAAVGVGLTLLEHTAPLRELLAQAERLKAGAVDRLLVANFRGSYRLAAQSMNEGIERAIEKSGGVSRKPADLESILGPTPAQPAMSAFSFPNQAGDSSAVPIPPPAAPPPGPSSASVATAAPEHTPAPSSGAALPKPPPPLPAAGRPISPPTPKAAFGAALSGSHGALAGVPSVHPSSPGDEEESTTVATVPSEVMAVARAVPGDDSSEWLLVYNDFIRIKRQCGEPTEGLTFDKFSQTLRKNRDVLVDRHGCKRVKFSVYVKEGRASLKATPLKD